MKRESPIQNKYYWVKTSEFDDFEPAQVHENYESLYFHFTNGCMMECKSTFDYYEMPEPIKPTS